MARSASDAVLDGTLDIIALGTILTVCSAEPTTYTEAVTTYALADVVIDSADFTKANGDVSGRKVTIGAQNGVLIDTSGTATHVAISTTVGTLLRVVTVCTSQALTANGSNTVNVPAFDFEILDPAAP